MGIDTSDPPFDILYSAIDGASLTSGGTITFQYPAGRAAVCYDGMWPAQMFIPEMQGMYTQDTDFTITYGPTNIVVTYLAATTVPAKSTMHLQLPVRDTSGLPTVYGTPVPISVFPEGTL